MFPEFAMQYLVGIDLSDAVFVAHVSWKKSAKEAAYQNRPATSFRLGCVWMQVDEFLYGYYIITTLLI